MPTVLRVLKEKKKSPSGNSAFIPLMVYWLKNKGWNCFQAG
jgi:hypothetical protein